MVNITNAQEWLEKTIPFAERQNIIGLSIIMNAHQRSDSPYHDVIQSMVCQIPERYRYYLSSKLVGSLDLSGFVNLKELVVFEQKITSLNLADRY